jgi:hypothetical protein
MASIDDCAEAAATTASCSVQGQNQTTALSGVRPHSVPTPSPFTPVVIPDLISVATVSHAAPPPFAGVRTVQEQPAALCVFALMDQTARNGGEKIGSRREDRIE